MIPSASAMSANCVGCKNSPIAGNSDATSQVWQIGQRGAATNREDDIVASRTRVASTGIPIIICMGLVGFATTPSAAAQSESEGGAPPFGVRIERMGAELVQARLDGAAARLEIRASQEPAWNAFAAAVKALFAAPPGVAARPERTANQPEDAAALLHRRAAAELARAQSLTQLADATSKLQAVFDPNQRQVLNQIVRTQLMGAPRVIGTRALGRGFGPNATYMTGGRAMPGGPDGPVVIIRGNGGDPDIQTLPDISPP